VDLAQELKCVGCVAALDVPSVPDLARLTPADPAIMAEFSPRSANLRVRRAAAVGLGLAVLFAAPAQAVDPGTAWATRTPAQVGLNIAKLNELRAATGWKPGSTTFRGFVVKNGYQVYTWGNVAQKGDWASAVKPVMSTMLFYALKELRTSGVNARIYQYGWPMTVPDRSMTWHHLANMVSGYALPENPGARWGYNDYAISLYCKTLFPKVFKQTMAAVVASRLAPLQFQDGAVIGSGRGGCQLFTSVRDAARIGWFWLNKGRWQGVQRLPASYFDSYRKNQVSATLPRTAGGLANDYLAVGSTGGGNNQDSAGQGRYGYNWWFNQPKRGWPSAPPDTFVAIGHHYNESIFVIPSRQLVFTCKCKTSGRSEADKYLRLLVEAHVGS
jgi:hypothetical protein